MRLSENKKLIVRSDDEFQNLINKTKKSAAKNLRVSINSLLVRRMNSKWASCSSKGNITINALMQYLPAYLIEYILFHEIAHIIEKKHNQKFWGLIEKEFPNYMDLEKELFIYWFKVISEIQQDEKER